MSEKKFLRVVVSAFIFNDKGEILLTRQSKWKNKYMVPGGGVKYGEELLKALEREIKEETNLEIKNIEFIHSGNLLNLKKDYKGETDHFVYFNYKAEVKDPSKIKLDQESNKYKWQKPENWVNDKDIYTFTKKFIEKYLLDNETFEYKYKRALADYQNLVKRTADEKTEFLKYANEQFILEILPVYENLKVSVEHNDNDTSDPWFEGVKYVLKQFKDILTAQGLEDIKTVGEKFDINTMEAVEDPQKNNDKISVEDNTDKDEKDKEIVVKEVKSGYKLKGKVIVPAKVVVE